MRMMNYHKNPIILVLYSKSLQVFELDGLTRKLLHKADFKAPIKAGAYCLFECINKAAYNVILLHTNELFEAIKF
jgi:hypothetical protein